ncbi:putative peptidoglycan glycosyltransferase FtsW [Terrarubrum flagellatum]|uniref:FtsW/RodA/SpoVE family cell cycle protein n=1 Tax=Terrirubrum flagellatum TaxID=2895980 RepID=UPI0031451378
MPSRTERSLFADWWWTVDRLTLACLIVLMLAGVVFLMGGGPPVAERLGLSPFHFVHRQMLWLFAAGMVMLATSFLSPRHIRRTALLIYVVFMALVVATLFFGAEVKGARRWIVLFGQNIQPSEFVKPAFVILAAWAFSEGARRPEMPGAVLGVLLLPMTIAPLVMQPDIGQTMLLSMVWAALFYLAGLHMFWVFGLGGAGAGGLVLAYFFFPHVTARVNRFLDKANAGGDTFQVDTAVDSFVSGSWFGKGPGEGTIKRILPDSHTDFLFAVTGEEFGIAVCLALVALFAIIVARALWMARRNEDPFCRFAAAGLTMLFGLQAAINMSVNLHLIPPKGMTLPFISYGGSSLLSLALGMGFLLASTRRRPRAEIDAPMGATFLHRAPA